MIRFSLVLITAEETGKRVLSAPAIV